MTKNIWFHAWLMNKSSPKSPKYNLLLFHPLLLMAEIRLTSWQVVYPSMYRVLYTPGGAGFLPSKYAKHPDSIPNWTLWINNSTWNLGSNSNFQAAEDSSPIVAQIESTLCGTFGAGAWRRGPNLLMLTGVLKFQNFPQGGPRSLVISRL